MKPCSNANTGACTSCSDRANFQSDDSEILYCTACAKEVLEHEVYQAAVALLLNCLEEPAGVRIDGDRSHELIRPWPHKQYLSC